MNTFRRHYVYLREHWSGTWTLEEEVLCSAFTECCNPSIPSATLTYEYGHIKSRFGNLFEYRLKADLIGWYVKVVVDQFDDSNATTREWIGVIVEESVSQLGDTGNSGNPSIVESGSQTFTAFGLEYLLERETYDSSFARNFDDTAELEFERGIAFNMGGSAHNSRRIHGNRNALSGDLAAPVFTSNLNTAEEWDAGQIIDYLLTYHPPADDSGVDRLGWYLDYGNSSVATLEAIRPKLDGHGESIKRLIDMVCDRRRSVGWKVVVDSNNRAAVQVFTFNTDAIVLPPGGGHDGGSIDANSHQITIAMADDARVLDSVLFTSSTSKFDRVIARGDRVVLCLSLQDTPETGQGTLIKDWTDALKDDYDEGGTHGTGYTAADPEQRKDRNEAARNSHHLHRVYRFFLWNPSKVNEELPVTDPDGDVLVNNKLLVCWPPGGRFMSDLPLRYDLDYTTPTDDAPDDDKPEDSVTEYVSPRAWIKDGTFYYPMDTMARGAGNAPLITRHWTASIAMRRDQLGIIINVHGQPGQHAIAKDTFIPEEDPGGDDLSLAADLKWQYIICTVALELDNWAEATYPEPETPLVGDDDTVKTLIVNVPDRQMHYVSKNTVFDISTAGTLFKTSRGGWIRDDSWELKWIARIAYEWYKQDRRAFEYTFHSLDCPYSVGQLVTALTSGSSSTDVNSVITSIAFDLVNGSYTLKTSFAEMDARGLL